MFDNILFGVAPRIWLYGTAWSVYILWDYDKPASGGVWSSSTFLFWAWVDIWRHTVWQFSLKPLPYLVGHVQNRKDLSLSPSLLTRYLPPMHTWQLTHCVYEASSFREYWGLKHSMIDPDVTWYIYPIICAFSFCLTSEVSLSLSFEAMWREANRYLQSHPTNRSTEEDMLKHVVKLAWLGPVEVD